MSGKTILLAPLLLILAACGSRTDSAGKADAIAPPCAYSTHVAAQNPPESPMFTLDPLGPLEDVTCNWQDFQPAEQFCVKLDGPEFTPGGSGVLTDGRDPACEFAGFKPEDAGLYKVSIVTPPLCAGCRRLFIDYSRIPEDDPAQQLFYAHGHAFYRIMSGNPGYTIEPNSHSPNTKNFYNDKLVSPPGTPVEQLVGAADTHFMAYVTSTRFFIHTAIQGPYYIGPWYLNREGERITGVFVDVNVGDATPSGNAEFDALRYMTAYNSGQVTCADNLSPMSSGGNLLYGGCFDRFGGARDAWNPF
jgi:hypothetical protein